MDEIPSLLLNEAPLPVFSLRLFYQLILYAYADFANFIPKSGIIEVLITFVEMQSTEQSNQMLQKQLYPLLSLLWEKCHLDSIFLLLENDFIPVSLKYNSSKVIARSLDCQDLTIGRAVILVSFLKNHTQLRFLKFSYLFNIWDRIQKLKVI